MAKVMFDYDAKRVDELTIKEGDMVKVLDQAEEGWWKGELFGRIGVFPFNFVELATGPAPKLQKESGPLTILCGHHINFKRSDVSFLFSLRNMDNLPPVKCPIYDHQHDKAIWCDPYGGAIFGGGGGGGGGGGNDLCISSNANKNKSSCSNLGYTYQPPPGYQPGTPQTKALLAGNHYFQPTEIEVFRRERK